MQRCGWVKPNNPIMVQYHDTEWGVPVTDDQKLFEMLILEGAQAGLNWETILQKRAEYRKAFRQFNPRAVARLSDEYLDKQLGNEKIIRHRLKIYSVRQNAKVFLSIQKEYGSFALYLWRYVKNCPVMNLRESLAEVPTQTPISIALAKDLKKRGMCFVGPNIMYAFMQAVGMVNDHLIDCPCHKRCIQQASVILKRFIQECV